MLVAALGLLTTIGLVTPPAAPTGAQTAGARAARSEDAISADFVERINGLRSSLGLGPLTPDPDLAATSLAWAEHLAAIGRLDHDPDLAAYLPTGATKIGENVGFGPDVHALFSAFVASPSHLENLTDPSYTRVGVATIWANGTLWTVHRFVAIGAPAPPLPAPPPTTQPAPPPTSPPAPASPPATPSSAAPPVASPPARPTAPTPTPTTTTSVAPPPSSEPPAEPERVAAVLDALRPLTG